MTSKYFSKFIKIVGRIAAGFSLSALVLGGMVLASSGPAIKLFAFPTAENIAKEIVQKVLLAILNAINGILGFCVGVFSWVASPDFFKVPLTNNAFVNSANQITLNLAYIAIIIAVLVIGVSTALKLGGAADYKKALPILIIVALLLPFSSIFCGLVIDASNMIASFFIGSGFSGGDAISAQSSDAARIIKNDLADTSSIFDGSVMVKFIFLVIFDFLLIVAVLLYTVLFLMRYIALLITIILAPLAMAFKALPIKGTSAYFDKWLTQLVNWSFVGASGAFFFFLGEQMISVISQGNFIAPADGSEIGMMADLLPYTVAIFFIYYGFFQALDTSAAGSDIAINFAKGQTTKFGNATKKFGVDRARDTGKAAVKSRATGKVAEAVSNLKGPTWGAGEKNPIGWAKRVAAGAVGAPIRSTQKAGAAVANKRDQFVNEAADRAKKLGKRDIGRTIDEAMLGTIGLAGNTEAGLIMATGLQDKKNQEELEKKLKGMNKNQVSAMTKGLIAEGKKDEARTIARHSLGLYQPDTDLGLSMTEAELVKGLKKEEDMKELGGDFTTRPGAVDAFMQHAGGSQKALLAKANDKFAEAHVNNLKSMTTGMYSQEVEKLSQEVEGKDLKSLIGDSFKGAGFSQSLLDLKTGVLESVVKSVGVQMSDELGVAMKGLAQTAPDIYVDKLEKVADFKNKNIAKDVISDSFDTPPVYDKMLESMTGEKFGSIAKMNKNIGIGISKHLKSVSPEDLKKMEEKNPSLFSALKTLGVHNGSESKKASGLVGPHGEPIETYARKAKEDNERQGRHEQQANSEQPGEGSSSSSGGGSTINRFYDMKNKK